MRKSQVIQVSYLDGLRYQRAVLAGCQEIISHEKEINKINVFPIPDKDTGSNLKKTLSPIIDKYPLQETTANKSSRGIADTAISAAFGYSGIIFAQFLSGFAEGIKNQKRLYVEAIPEAAEMAVARAYESIENPQEGTILSVFKEWSDEVKKLSSATKDFVQLLKKSLKRANSALMETPQQLEVLRKHKVVDAGGKAFIHFLEGIIHYIKKGELQTFFPAGKEQHKRKDVYKTKEAQFCAECCVRRKNLDRPRLIEKLNSLGQDLIFYSSSGFAKIHIRTNNTEEIFSCAAQFGNISSKKIFKFKHDLPSQEKKEVALVADTTCDISEKFIENNDIYFVPIKIQTKDRILTDKLDIIPEEFYQILSTSSFLPKTSQPSRQDFTSIYEHLLFHYQSIISIHLSSKLSGTFQTALQAAQSINKKKIAVLDGKNLSVGLGLLMMEGINALKQGMDYEAASNQIKKAINNIKIFIGIPTLKYLVKGGRVTRAKGLITRILNINPVLSINQEGELKPVGKTRGKKRLEQKVFELALEKINKAKTIHTGTDPVKTHKEEPAFSAAVAHTNSPLSGERVAKKINERLKIKVTMVMNASPALGVHAGPGAIGIALHKINNKK